MKTPTHPLRTAVASAVLVGAGLTSFSALAASPERPGATARAEIQQTYRAERAACLDGSSTQARGACLAEASAARKEALAGVLGLQTVARSDQAQPTEPDLLANALSRCDAIPGDVRAACEQRVIGGGGVIVTGSVAEGAIIRELAPVEAPIQVARAEPAPAAVAADATAPGDAKATAGGETNTNTNASAGAGAGSLPVIVAEPTEPLMQAAPTATQLAPGESPASSQGLSEGETLVPVEPAQATGLVAEPLAERPAEAAAEQPAEPATERPLHPAVETTNDSATGSGIGSPADPASELATEPTTVHPAVAPARESSVQPLPDARVELQPEAAPAGADLPSNAAPAPAPASAIDGGSASGADPVAFPKWMVQQRFE